MSVDTSNATATAGADPSRVRVAGAIKQAASTTGTSFEYLLTTAKMESDFNPKAGASTTSARGLFQFIEECRIAQRSHRIVKRVSHKSDPGRLPSARCKRPRNRSTAEHAY